MVRKKGNIKKPVPQKSTPEPLSAYTITMVGKYICTPMLPIAELLVSMEVSMAHDNPEMQLI